VGVNLGFKYFDSSRAGKAERALGPLYLVGFSMRCFTHVKSPTRKECLRVIASIAASYLQTEIATYLQQFTQRQVSVKEANQPFHSNYRTQNYVCVLRKTVNCDTTSCSL
jgi:hypothetical protein